VSNCKKRNVCLFLLGSLVIGIAGCRTTADVVPPIETKVKPGFTSFNYGSTRQAFIQEEYEKVLESAETIRGADISLKTTCHALYYVGMSYMMQADYSRARDVFMYMKKHRKKVYNISQVELALAKISFREESYKTAINEFESFIKDYPDDGHLSTAHYMLAESYQKVGKFEQANEIFQMIPEKYPLSFESQFVEQSDVSKSESFRLQVASFFDKGNADRYTKELQDKGYDVSVLKTQKEGGFMYRVQIGNFDSKSSAEAYKRELKDDGLDAFIYP